ncbi:transcriptional regulator [Salmonella enterica subsp. enterica serovar Javiana]|nr:transcriptional regulator [Salmonella enterica subsp. enterica serovar Javiana]ECV1375368.1 transcriptional regulator [Salmonella enterica subsp. enterica serovar Javiana]EEI9041252.1 transcriptional regulator [Salmonella enterica subsp. enterica serovar Javiana]
MIVEKCSNTISHLTSSEISARIRQGWLIPGSVTDAHFWSLVGISSMHSDKIINALFDFLVKGKPRKEVCISYGVNSGHFSIGLNRLQHISHAAAKMAEYYC